MSSDSEEYISDNSDSDVSQSTTGLTSGSITANRPSEDITILDTETDDESVTEVIKKKTGRRRRAVILSDSEEEDELDQRGLSPRTRMSITGVRPQDLSDDSSEIDYSEDEDQPSVNEDNSKNSDDANISHDKELKSKETSFDQSGSIHEGPEDADVTHDGELESNNHTPQSVDQSGSIHEGPEDAEITQIGELVFNNHTPPTADKHDDIPRYSTQFVNRSEDILHSTLVPIAEHQQPEQTEIDSTNSSNNDVLILSNKEVTIEISSDEENVSPNTNSAKGSTIDETPNRSLLDDQNVQNENVSRDFYEDELRKVAEMRTQLIEAVKLYDMVSHKLHDNGIQIKKRIDGLKADIAKKTEYLDGVKVQKEVPNKVAETKIVNQPKPAVQELDWDDLSAAVNSIQPKHTGTQGLATFNTQKALTVDSLKDLHGSLKDCPAENVLADDPSGLKVQLMDHQKHALAWMSWREQQRPRGGILADDMGLGKTLTMISLMLACKNRQESDSAPKSASSDEGEEENPKSSSGWCSKGRKDHYNGGTLVVCPASLIRQWESEVGSKLSRHRLSVCVHHGPSRDSKSKHLCTYDMVVTTYNIVAREHKCGGALFGVKWRRVILDEAHVVRNYKSQSSLSVCELRSKFRWALTGTPIQNKEIDVYALLKFLRCSPFDDLTMWKRWIDNKSAGGQNRLNLLMKSIMLRRTKVQLQLDGKLNSLPNKQIRLVEMKLDKYEMNVYQRVMTYSRSLFAQFLLQRAEKDSDMNYVQDAYKPTHKQTKGPNDAYFKMHERITRMAGHDHTKVKSHEILVLLLRLRQICCHPGLIDAMLEDEGAGNVSHNDSQENSVDIDLLDQLNKMTIDDTTSPEGDAERPLDGDELRFAKASQNVLKRSNPVFDLNRPSTKLLKTIDILKTSVLNTDDKVIIVSQWRSVLDILRDMLNKERIASLSLNGTIPVKNRQDIVNEFNDPRCPKRILLLSLTAGGVGLNLIGANHLILLDLHWNPQLEAQAQDRIYRVGQKKDVIIYKMVCMDTVEERIKALQDRKLELADGLLTGNKVSTKLTIDDLKGLFGM